MLEIKNIVKRYGAIKAVDGIGFAVRSGEILGLLGPNGAGKTTTMNIISGYISANSGDVIVNGTELYADPVGVKRQIGYLPETPPVYGDMTVIEYLRFVADLKKCRFDRELHLNEICEVTGLTDYKSRLIKNLSKGFKQRVGIAQVLIGNPEIMIFDEPTAGLDPKEIVEIRSLIRKLGKNHTVIQSTHILPEAQAVCDRIIIIDRGHIVADQKTAELSKTVRVTHRMLLKACAPKKEALTFLRSMPGISRVESVDSYESDCSAFRIESEKGVDIRKPLFNSFASKGWPIVGLEASDANLEDIFLALTDDGEEDKQKVRTTRRSGK